MVKGLDISDVNLVSSLQYVRRSLTYLYVRRSLTYHNLVSSLQYVGGH